MVATFEMVWSVVADQLESASQPHGYYVTRASGDGLRIPRDLVILVFECIKYFAPAELSQWWTLNRSM